MTTTAAPPVDRAARPRSQVLGQIDPRWAWRGLALGLGSNLFLPIGGQISVLELVAVLALPATVATAQRRPQVVYLAAAIGVLVLGGVASSLMQGDATAEVVALVANYGVPLALVLGVLHLVDRHGMVVLRWLAVGSALSQVVGTLVLPDESQLIDPWKFGYGFAASLLVVLLVDRARGPQARVLGIGAGLALTVAHLALGSRFLAALVLVAVVVSALGSRPQTATPPSTGTGTPPARRLPLGAVLVGLVGVSVLYLAYTQLAGSGALGEIARYKFLNQNGDYGLLIGGRKELVFLLFAFGSSPLMGWGATAQVPYLDRLDTARWFAENGYRLDYSDTLRLVRPPGLPLHSITLGMLVVAGVFALPAVLALLTQGVRAVRGALVQGSALYAYVALLGVLHLLTSPLGSTTRAPVAACVALGILFAARGPGPDPGGQERPEDAGPAVEPRAGSSR